MNFNALEQEQWDQLEDNLVHVDHRDDEDGLIKVIAESLQLYLKCHWEEDTLLVTYRSQHYVIPLTFTPHNHYVTISSIALLLNYAFTFWVAHNSLENDTHSLVILINNLSKQLKKTHQLWLIKNLVKLELGFDYFYSIKIPYLHNKKNAPDFEKESINSKQEKEVLFQALSNMKITDPQTIKKPNDQGVVFEKETRSPPAFFYAAWIGSLVFLTMYFANLDL